MFVSTFFRSARCSTPRALAALALAFMLYAADLPRAFAQACTTTITGKVYSPLGPTSGDPIPNILVYVATTPVQALPQGLTSCAGESQLVTGNPLVSTNTAADGSFSLTSTGLNTIANPVNVVIQAGKWRRQNSVTITPCTTNTFNFTMPANQSQGDLPHIAVVTGEADGIECIFRQIGISDSEFTDPNAGGSINLYEGSATKTSGGAVVNPSDSPVPSESSLVESKANLNSYDLVMFGCQGTASDAIATGDQGSALENLVSYANTGGRIFATHYGYVWLDTVQPFESSANWITPEINPLTEPGFASGEGVATIDTSYPEGAVLADWMQNIGASYNGQYGQVLLQNMRLNENKVYNPPAQSWVNLNNYTGNPSLQFTFDTPVNATTTPTVALTFANNPTNFHPGDSGDDVTINVTDTSTTTPADNSLTLNLLLPPEVTATSLTGANAGTGWICAVSTLTCNRTSALPAGATDPVLLVLAVAPSAPLGHQTVSASITGGGISGTNQCGRVLYNDYHVESGTTITTAEKYPKECSTGAVTPQEKFLEFSLYNLSNFVAPVTSDVIDIQAVPIITWTTPAPVYYGTPLSSTQLDATANAAGTFVYNPAAGTVLGYGTTALNVTFTPTDPTSYTTASAAVNLNVLPDTTTTTLTSSPDPSVYGSNVAFTATVTGNAAAPVGTVYFYDSGTLIGSASLSTSTGDSSVATLNSTTLAPGIHTITAVYNNPPYIGGGGGTGANPADFGVSTSLPLYQTVLATSSTSITGLTTPIDYGQIIGYTAIITVAGSSTGGTVSAYIDGVVVCTLPVAPGLTNVCPANTGAGYPVGTHTVYAVFTGDSVYAGSTSPTYTVQIVPDPTTTSVNSSLNPSFFTNSVTFTATVTAPYATPTGMVTFYDGATSLGFGTLVSQSGLSAAPASATYSTTQLSVGTHNITASYAATTDFNASVSSPALAQVVNPPLPLFGNPGFILTVTPTSLNAPIGAGTGISVNINEVNGYSIPITLSCSGLPTEATCGFTQAVVPAGGGTVTLYLTPASPHTCGTNNPYFVASNSGKGLPLLAVAALGLFFTRRRRKLFRGLTLAVLLCCLPVLNGCGDGCTDFGTKPGSYSFTITATPQSVPAGSNPAYTGPQSQTVNFNATL